VAFDIDRLAVLGGAVPVLEGVASGLGRAFYHVADNGTLVYSPATGAVANSTLVWVDRQGNEEVIPTPPRAYVRARVSPDGTRVALEVRDQDNDIWIWNLMGQTLTRATFDRTIDGNPVWSPDGRRIAYQSTRLGRPVVFWRAADGTGSEERLGEGTGTRIPTAFSPDGKWLLFHQNVAGTLLDVLRLETAGSHAVQSILQTQFSERNAEVSPDGRWLAYQSDESGIQQVFVRPFPDVQAGRWQVSTDGGVHPAWSPSGRELFYLGVDDGLLRSVAVSPAGTFTASRPATVMRKPYFVPVPTWSTVRSFDVSPDGDRFLMIKDEDAPAQADRAEVIVLLNWHEELKRRVPPTR
jgi:Tol biopolymer transport system component